MTINVPGNLGIIFLAVGLIVYGLAQVWAALAVPAVLVALWAILTGLLLLAGR